MAVLLWFLAGHGLQCIRPPASVDTYNKRTPPIIKRKSKDPDRVPFTAFLAGLQDSLCVGSNREPARKKIRKHIYKPLRTAY